MAHFQGPTVVPGKRCKRDALRVVFVSVKEVAQGRPEKWYPELKPQVGAPRSSAVEGVAAAIPACLAEEGNRVSGQELSEEDEAVHADVVREAKN